MLVSFVTGTYNRITSLQRLFASIRAQILPGIEYEFVVCDGGSTDGTLEWLRQQPDTVPIEDGELKGAISAFTRAAFTARGKYVMLLNDDVEVKPGAILPAIVHLENTPSCGAVAYKDNRPIPPYYDTSVYKTLRMPAIVKGKQDYVIYAQVGMFRKWLGDKVHWWMGEHDEMAGARTYGGDNCLSAHIWRYGYSVDEVEACIVHDYVIEDELRKLIRDSGQSNDDSMYYYNQWPKEWQGATVPDKPLITQQNQRATRILYLPIYEPGWPIQKHPQFGKRGLRDALTRAKNKHGEPCIVQEIDYMSIPPEQLRQYLLDTCESFRPDVLLTQIQAPKPLTAEILGELRSRYPMVVINWNGDVWTGGLKSGEMMQILQFVDLQTLVTKEVTDFYTQMGVTWAYWQIGYEEPGNVDGYFKNYPDYPVVFMASLYSDARKAVAAVVQEFGGMTFSPGDQWETLYNFAAGKFIYNRAKIALANNDYPDSYGFVSNRMMQALAAGGAMLLQQHVEGLDELTGLRAGEHYIEYTDMQDLRAKIAYYLAHEDERKAIADNGTLFVRANHNFDVRVKELFEFIRTKLAPNKQIAETVHLRYLGKNKETFGLGRAPDTGIRYEFQVGHLLAIHKADYNWLMQTYPNMWEVVE